MNFKSASFCLLSISLLAQSPNVLAAKKTTLEEVKELQSALLKNKNSIANLLNTKAHIIPKETENLISGPGAGNYTRKAPLYSAIRQMSLEHVKEGREDLFKGQDAMANLLKGYQMTEEDKAEPSTNPTEKIYSIAVLNTQNLEAMKKANEELIKISQEDDFLKRMSRYVELTIKGERYISFKQAEDLSNQIYKMNQDLEQVEELAIKLPVKEQQVVETFRKNMNEWLNKKLVFTEINKKGFTADINLDSMAVLHENKNNIQSFLLSKNYTSENIAYTIKYAIVDRVRAKHAYSSWDDLKLKSDANTEHKISFKEINDVNVVVSADRLKATISTKKFSINNTLLYPRVVKLAILQDGKELYNHDAQNHADYYNPNNSLVRAQLQLVKGYEIQMKNMYKNYGAENFGTDLGKVEVKIK